MEPNLLIKREEIPIIVDQFIRYLDDTLLKTGIYRAVKIEDGFTAILPGKFRTYNIDVEIETKKDEKKSSIDFDFFSDGKTPLKVKVKIYNEDYDKELFKKSFFNVLNNALKDNAYYRKIQKTIDTIQNQLLKIVLC